MSGLLKILIYKVALINPIMGREVFEQQAQDLKIPKLPHLLQNVIKKYTIYRIKISTLLKNSNIQSYSFVDKLRSNTKSYKNMQSIISRVQLARTETWLLTSYQYILYKIT